MYLKPCKIEDKVEFQKEFEPKIILENEESRVLLFALEKEQEIPSHKTSVDAMIFVIKGEISFMIDDEIIKIDEKEMMLIPKEKEHSLKAEKKSIFFVIRI